MIASVRAATVALPLLRSLSHDAVPVRELAATLRNAWLRRATPSGPGDLDDLVRSLVSDVADRVDLIPEDPREPIVTGLRRQSTSSGDLLAALEDGAKLGQRSLQESPLAGDARAVALAVQLTELTSDDFPRLRQTAPTDDVASRELAWRATTAGEELDRCLLLAAATVIGEGAYLGIERAAIGRSINAFSWHPWVREHQTLIEAAIDAAQSEGAKPKQKRDLTRLSDLSRRVDSTLPEDEAEWDTSSLIAAGIENLLRETACEATDIDPISAARGVAHERAIAEAKAGETGVMAIAVHQYVIDEVRAEEADLLAYRLGT